MNPASESDEIGKPIEAKIPDVCRKTKSLPEPDAIKKNAIKQRPIVAISIPFAFRDAARRAVLRWLAPTPVRPRRRRRVRTGSGRRLRAFGGGPNRAGVLQPCQAR